MPKGIQEGRSPDDDLLHGFEAGTLATFPHAAHVRVTLLYLARFGFDGAAQRLGAGLQRFAAAKGQPDKFHVTMTRAWLELIEAARRAHPSAADPDAVVTACPELLDQDALLRFYSRERLFSEEARTGWIEPDRGPITVARGGR